MQMLKLVFLMFFLILWGCAPEGGKSSPGLKSSTAPTSSVTKADVKTPPKAKRDSNFTQGGD